MWGEAGAKELCRVMGNPISCGELSPGGNCSAGSSAHQALTDSPGHC